MEEASVPELLSELPTAERIAIEETLAWFLESHAIEAIDAASRSLGRHVCVDNLCMNGGHQWR